MLPGFGGFEWLPVVRMCTAIADFPLEFFLSLESAYVTPNSATKEENKKKKKKKRQTRASRGQRRACTHQW